METRQLVIILLALFMTVMAFFLVNMAHEGGSITDEPVTVSTQDIPAQ